MVEVPNGIILITGATGTGKSTTVYTMLQHLNKEETNIITVEDPIEMNIEGINQVQVNPEIGLTFGRVLRSILRRSYFWKSFKKYFKTRSKHYSNWRNS